MADQTLIPGSGTVGQGFNIFGAFDDGSLVFPLFDTQSRDHTVEVDGVRFAIARSVTLHSDADTTGETHVFLTQQEVQTHFAARARVEGKTATFAGSFEASYGRMVRNSASYAFAMRDLYTRRWSLSLSNPSADGLADGVRDEFAALPDAFSGATRDEFYSFFEKFGTHFVSRVQVGARLYYYIAVRKSFSSERTDVKARAEAEYNGFLASGKAEAEAEWHKAGKEWVESRDVQIEARGGSTDILHSLIPRFGDNENGAFTKWLDSIATGSVATIGYLLRPVSVLFSGSKQRAVEEAYEDYTQHYVSITASEQKHGILVSGRAVESPDFRPPILRNPTSDHSYPATIAAMQAVVLDRQDLSVVENVSVGYHEFTGPFVSLPAEAMDEDYRRVLDALRPYEGNPRYLLAVTTGRLSSGLLPPADLLQFFRTCGAGSGLEEWQGAVRFSSWFVFLGNYVLLGRMGSAPGSALYEHFERGHHSDWSPWGGEVWGPIDDIERTVILRPTRAPDDDSHRRFLLEAVRATTRVAGV